MELENNEDRLKAMLASASSGDEAAWRSIIDLFSPRVYALLLKSCRDPELAQELTQATFVKVVQNLARYNEQGRFQPWLFRIAMNKLRDEMRRKKRHAKSMDMRSGSDEDYAQPWQMAQASIVLQNDHSQKNDPQQIVDTQEQVKKLMLTIEQMNPANKKILELRHIAGLSFAEIAETLDQPLGTVLARGHRALKKLKAMLTEEQSTIQG